MPPVPTPDPSASLTPFQAYGVAFHGWAADLGQLGYVAGVTALALVVFSVAVVAVVASFGRR